jgi:hypothetical protein
MNIFGKGNENKVIIKFFNIRGSIFIHVFSDMVFSELYCFDCHYE